MKKFEIEVYNAQEAFINSILYTKEEELKNEAIQVFAGMMRLDNEIDRFDYMIEYLENHNEFYVPIPDGLREYLDLDAGAYYLEEGWAM